MTRSLFAAIAVILAGGPAWASLVDDVRVQIARNDLASADREVRAIRAAQGANAEVAAAYSWLARGALESKHLQQADAYATEARKMAMSLLGVRRIDNDPWLPTAVGAAIEVHAHVLAASGDIPGALAFLRRELMTWAGTSLVERIRKNENLLGMEGKPAPSLEGVSLAAFRGRPVLLFFWAHWCPDCKADVPVIAAIEKRFGPRGLAVVGPTRLYGYAAGGEPAPAAAERQYIEHVRQQYYAPLGNMPTPVSEANFQLYGASTTPTFVLIDPAGIVRYYHPGAVTEPELSAKVQALLK